MYYTYTSDLQHAASQPFTVRVHTTQHTTQSTTTNTDKIRTAKSAKRSELQETDGL